jgi:hypothetical protein
MLDFLLEFAVVILPTLFAVGIQVGSEEIKKRPLWRVGVISFGVLVSALTWCQMSRASKKARMDQEAAIERTSERVAAEASSRITDTLNKQYGTYIGALYREIGSLEGKVGNESGLHRRELALSYTPSLDIIYAGDQLQIWNRGKTNITLWGDKYDGGKPDIEAPAIISPTTYYYLLTDKLKAFILASLGQNGEARVPLDIYISAEDKQKYVMHCELWEIVKDGQITIHTQNHGFEKRDWSK